MGILFNVVCGKGFSPLVIVNCAVTTPYFRNEYGNYFTPSGWAKLVEAVKQRNSTEGMSQLELFGRPTVESDDGGEQNN